MDTLSAVLEATKLRAVVYSKFPLGSPWGLDIIKDNNSQFWRLVSGSCYVGSPDGRIIPLELGDLLWVPNGSAHWIADSPHSPRMPSPEFRQARSAGTPVFTSGVNETVLIAGHFEFDYLPMHPFLAQLPPVIHIKQYGTENQLLLQQISQWMLKELNDTLPGGSLMLKSLSEILFVNIIRAYLEQAPPDSGFLAALNDPRISRALQLIHDSPENDWTLDSLASAVAMSRSVFFNQFKRLVQETPLNYLTDWRIRKAQAMLTTATGSVADVAAFVGYQSESAFNRVFKTRTGETPAAYRRSRAVR